MRRAYVKKVILMTLMSLTVSMPVYAEWNKESDKWIWTENQEKSIGWKQIQNKWYHFDEKGHMNTGWIQDNDKWYMLNDDGTMVNEWKQINGKWYYFNDSGIMQSGWVKDNEKWYKFDDHGVMVTGWFEENEKWYHMSPSGIMDKGWKEIDDEWYMFDDHGIMLTGWIQDNDTWYYADSKGRLEKGSISIDGKSYTFAENGAMLSGANDQTTASSQEDYNKKAYVNTNSDFLNVRSEASTESSVVDKLARGTEVNIVGNIQNGFYPIVLNEKNAWVSSDWISFEKPTDIQSNTEEDKKPVEDHKENNGTVTLGGIRTTSPSLNDVHYYSDANIFYKVRLSPPFFNSSGEQIRGNCTWYAWGRAWELTGKPPIEANFIGNAYEWWESNKRTGKYKYGTEPKVGAIAVWNSSLPGSGGCGHVAVVEKIDNNKTYISESMWHGDCFKYQEIYSTQYLYGYIYLDGPNY